MDSDFLLVQKMKMGNQLAIDEFVHKYYYKILQYCKFHINDAGDAEDATQDIFIKFFRSLLNYKHYGKVVNYLYVIAANTCKDYYKKKKEVLAEDLLDRATSSMENIEEKIDIENALKLLPEDIKETAILFFFQSLKQKEIAEILDIGLPLVKYRIKRARELLTYYLKEGR